MRLTSPEVEKELKKDSRVYINSIGDIYFHSAWIGQLEYELDTGRILLYLAANSSTARQRAWLDNIEAVEYTAWLNSVYKKLDLKPIAYPIDYNSGKYNIVEVIRISNS